MRNLFVLASFVFALSLRTHAADEQTVTVKNVSIAKGQVSVKAEWQGKSIHLWCSTSGPFCAEPSSGEYSMVRAVTADDAIYQDCTDVVLFKSSSITKEKIGVYCWLDSGDCYMYCGIPLNVETFQIPTRTRKAVEFPTAEPEPPKCKGNPKVVGGCYSIRGRLTRGADTVGLRLWPVGTKRMLGVTGGRELDDAVEPNWPQRLKFDHGDEVIYGDFEVCPFTPERNGEMRLVCIESVSHVVVKRQSSSK
jgi:hypothetical protein